MKTLCLFCGILLLAGSLWAQETTGAITGTIHDSSGAVVPNASVTIKNTGTGAERKVTSNGSGTFTATLLPVGTYDVTVEATGFKRSVTSGIALSVNDRLSLNVSLEVGSVAETATVTASVTLLETENATLSGLVDSRKVADLPLNGRNFAQLINLEAGVSLNNNGNQGSGQYVNGARGTENNFLLDGGDLNDPVVPNGSAAGATGAFTGSSPGINAVSVDAVAEFRVITSNASAEFGRSSGAQINVITKSGTNQFHGTLFEFARNRVFDARSFFDTNLAFKRDGKAIAPPFTQNNFGGTLGGPIWKDKTFFFGSYEGFRQRQGISVTNNIPSPNTIAAVAQQNTALGQIFAAVFQGPFSAPVANDPSVSAIIAANRPVLTPKSLVRSNSFDQNAYLGKVDHYLSEKARLSARYTYFHNVAGPGTVSGTGLPATGVGFTNTVHNALINETQTFSATRLNELRVTFERNGVNNTFDPAPQGVLDAGKLRTGIFAGQSFGDPFTPNGFPTLDLGYGIPELGYATTAPNIRFSNTYQVNDVFTWTRGGSSMRIGGELRRIQDNSTFSFLVRPNDQWDSAGANTILQPTAPVSFFTQNLFLLPATSERGFRITEWAPFVQETFRLTTHFVLDLGLRYEYLGRASEVNGFLSNAFLAPGGKPLLGKSLLANGPAGLNQVRLITVGRGRSQGLFEPDTNNLAPRVGAAYTWRNTTFRASYGIFYDRIFDNVLGNARNSPPFVVPVTTGSIAFGSSVSPPDVYTTTLPIGPTTVNPNLQFPRTQRWNFSIQQQVGKDQVLEVAYVGSMADHLVRTINPNFGGGFPNAYRPSNVNVPTDPPLTNDNFRPPVLANFSTRDSSDSSTYNALEVSFRRRYSSGLAFQLTYTYSHAIDGGSGEIITGIPVASVTNLLPVRNANGTIPFPSLAVINQVRQGQGLAPFTTDAQAAPYFVQNFVAGPQLGAEFGNADFDLRHAAVINFIYDLPFGQGRPWASNVRGFAGKLISGWQTNGILRFQTGQPFSLLAGLDVNGNGTSNDRAALLSGSLKNLLNHDFGKNGSRQYLVLNNGATLGVTPTPQVAGSMLSRNDLFGPGVEQIDFSLFKNTFVNAFGENNLNIQFRAEAFNLFNHTNFASPASTTITSPVFGQVQATTVPGRQIQLGLKLIF